MHPLLAVKIKPIMAGMMLFISLITASTSWFMGAVGIVCAVYLLRPHLEAEDRVGR